MHAVLVTQGESWFEALYLPPGMDVVSVEHTVASSKSGEDHTVVSDEIHLNSELFVSTKLSPNQGIKVCLPRLLYNSHFLYLPLYVMIVCAAEMSKPFVCSVNCSSSPIHALVWYIKFLITRRGVAVNMTVYLTSNIMGIFRVYVLQWDITH